MKYRIYASLFEEKDAGWVWIDNPKLPPRCIVRIRNLKNGKSIYCEALQIDKGFMHRYNKDPRIHIEDPKSALVINRWYREGLSKRRGDFESRTNQELNITQFNNCITKCIARIFSCLGHPQIIVRISTWLAIISIVLGLLSVFLSAKVSSNSTSLLPKIETPQESVYNEAGLNKQLRGKTGAEVVKILGSPNVVKPCEECEEKLEYWWYNLPKGSVFVHFRDGMVYMVRVVEGREK